MINEKQDSIQNEVVQKAIKFFESNKLGHINASMRFGKISCTFKIINKMYKISPSILLCYPDNKIEMSWKNEKEKWLANNFDNVKYVNFSSLHKYRGEKFDLFLIDEWHSLSYIEMSIAKVISNNSLKTLALSGTVNKERQDRWPELKEIAKYTTLQGIYDGILADYQITVHLVDLDTKIKTPNKKGKMKSEKNRYDDYSYVMKQFKENGKDFMHLALARNRLSLNSIAKVQYTKELLHNKMQDKRVLIFSGLSEVADQFPNSYHSKSSDNSNYTMFLNKDINWLSLASMGKVGISYPSLDSVILLNFTYSASDTAQILNRAIQLDYNGKIADLHVICLNEPPELKKVKESLSMLDKNRIKYINFEGK